MRQLCTIIVVPHEFDSPRQEKLLLVLFVYHMRAPATGGCSEGLGAF